jgi:hypothetical protein
MVTVKLVLFSPSPLHWAVDIYINGERVYCGKGFAIEQTAMFEAIQWLTNEFGLNPSISSYPSIM